MRHECPITRVGVFVPLAVFVAGVGLGVMGCATKSKPKDLAPEAHQKQLDMQKAMMQKAKGGPAGTPSEAPGGAPGAVPTGTEGAGAPAPAGEKAAPEPTGGPAPQ